MNLTKDLVTYGLIAKIIIIHAVFRIVALSTVCPYQALINPDDSFVV